MQIYGDTQPEDDESIRLQLTKVSGAVAGQVIGTLLILNDDTIVSVNNLPPLQEKSAGSQSRHFTVSLAFASSNTVSVAYGFATSNAATYGDDFTAPGGNAATLTFAPGETSKSVFVDVLGDTLPENDEPISIQLLNVVNGVFDGTARTGQLLIVNDDAAPSLSLNDVIQAEGSGGMTNFTFTVTLSKVSGQVVTVSYQTANGSAVKPGDYIGKAGTLTFAPGETTKTITVTVAGDAVHENDETFTVDLSNPVNATLLDGQGQGTILDDDASI